MTWDPVQDTGACVNVLFIPRAPVALMSIWMCSFGSLSSSCWIMNEAKPRKGLRENSASLWWAKEKAWNHKDHTRHGEPRKQSEQANTVLGSSLKSWLKHMSSDNNSYAPVQTFLNKMHINKRTMEHVTVMSTSAPQAPGLGPSTRSRLTNNLWAACGDFVNLEDLPAQSSKILIAVGFAYVCS